MASDLDEAASDGRAGSPWGRALKIVLLVIGLAVAGIAVTSLWLGEEQQDLPFDYERFE